MDKIIVKGGTKLKGEVEISGAQLCFFSGLRPTAVFARVKSHG